MSDVPESVRGELRDQLAAMQALAQGGHVEQASEACSRIRDRLDELLRDRPDNAELTDLRAAMLTNLADLAEQRGEWGHAESAWHDAVPILEDLARRFPHLPRYRQLLGQARYRLGDLYLLTYQPAKAAPHLRAAAEAWEASGGDRVSLARAASKRGDVERQLRRAEDAIKHYRHAQAIFESMAGEDVADELVHVCRQVASTLRDTDRLPEAIAEFEATTAFERRHPVAPDRRAALFADLAAACQAGARPDRAEESVRRALALVGDPGSDWFDRGRVVAWLNRLGVLYLDTGRLGRAERTFRLAVERGDGHPDRDLATPVHRAAAAFNLVRAVRLLGRDADAEAAQVLAMIRRLEARFPDEPAVASLRDSVLPGVAQPAPPRLPELKAVFLTWRLPGPPPLARDHGAVPADLAAPFRQARALAAENRLDDAIAVLAGVLASNRSLPVQYDLIDLLRAAGREGAALAALDQLLKEQPRYADGWFLRGLVLGRFLDPAGGPPEPLNFARHDEAIDAFDEAVLLEPEEPAYRLWKGRALFRLAHALMARNEALAEACRKQSLDAREPLALARAEAACATLRAEESFRAAAALAPDDPEPKVALATMLEALRAEDDPA